MISGSCISFFYLFCIIFSRFPRSDEFYISKSSCSYQVPSIDEVILQVPLKSQSQSSTTTNEIEDDSSEYDSIGVRRFLRSAGSNSDDDRSVSKRENNNLRIFIYYDNSSIDQLPTEAQREYVRERLVPRAVDFWERALSLRHSNDARIRLNRKCETQKYFLHTTTRQQSCFGSCRDVTKCGEVTVPDEHLNQCHSCASDDLQTCSYNGPPDGPGVIGADFILYVSAQNTDRCVGRETVAYAAHCQQEDTLDRPIAGHVNLCPRSISVNDRDQEVLVSTVKHEILHALGFSAGLFAFYRDEDGRPLTPRNEVGKPVSLNRDRSYYEWSDRVVKTITRADWWTRSGRLNHTIYMMVTPRVQKEAREHFNCDQLEGAELENQGTDGTAFTHWEKRVFENEAMTGTHTQSPAYSRLTLALMEDTGWYVANYSMAEQLAWGAHLGCEFAQKSCGEWIETREKVNLPIAPFCKQIKGTESKSLDATSTCTLTRRSVGLCNLKIYDRQLPPEYQYFSSPTSRRDIGGNLGGSVELADFCPYPQEFEWNNTGGRERDSRCFLEENTPERYTNAAVETYGPESICFNHGGSWTQKRCGTKRTYERLGAGCHEYECADGRLWLRLSKNLTAYPCYKTGQVIRIRQILDGWLHEGAIICPSCQDVCGADGIFECSKETDEFEPVGDPVVGVPCVASRNLLDTYARVFLFVFGLYLRL